MVKATLKLAMPVRGRTGPKKLHSPSSTKISPVMNEPRDIVVVGGALGGLSALCKIVSRMPRDFNAAILVAFDTASQPACAVLQILGNYSHLPVSYAEDGAAIEAGRVVLTPVGTDMRIAHPGIIVLDTCSALSGSGQSVDGLFASAAAVYGKRVIGVVLTGGSHDGTKGLTAIEAAGGVGVVQNPDEAVDSAMPLSALRGDHPDYCASIERIASLVARLAAGESHPEKR